MLFRSVLEPRERERLVRLVIQGVEYDGTKGEIAVTFQPMGIAMLAEDAQGNARCSLTLKGEVEKMAEEVA